MDELQQGLSKQFELHARKVVHEASNPLSVVRNYLVLLREQLGDKTKGREEFDLIESELRRVAGILQQMKQFATPTQASMPSVVEINALISEVVQLCRMGKREVQHITVTTALEEGLPPLQTNGDKVRQILMNLIFNAAEALPQDGKITVGSARWRDGKGMESVEISVTDNGPGLPPDVLAQLYKPAQSAKGGDHQGLGLSIINGLVDELGGVLRCKSSPSGTCFKILFPAAN